MIVNIIMAILTLVINLLLEELQCLACLHRLLGHTGTYVFLHTYVLSYVSEPWDISHKLGCREAKLHHLHWISTFSRLHIHQPDCLHLVTVSVLMSCDVSYLNIVEYLFSLADETFFSSFHQGPKVMCSCKVNYCHLIS